MEKFACFLYKYWFGHCSCCRTSVVWAGHQTPPVIYRIPPPPFRAKRPWDDVTLGTFYDSILSIHPPYELNSSTAPVKTTSILTGPTRVLRCVFYSSRTLHPQIVWPRSIQVECDFYSESICIFLYQRHISDFPLLTYTPRFFQPPTPKILVRFIDSHTPQPCAHCWTVLEYWLWKPLSYRYHKPGSQFLQAVHFFTHTITSAHSQIHTWSSLQQLV